MLKKTKAEIKQSLSDWLLAWKTENNELYIYIFGWLSILFGFLSALTFLYPVEKETGIFIYFSFLSLMTYVIFIMFLLPIKHASSVCRQIGKI